MSQPINDGPSSPSTDVSSPELDGQLADGQPPNSGSSLCTCKALAKFLLIYLISTIFAVLCFVAIYRECQTEDQVSWWWIFIASLIFSFSAFVLSLTVMIYSDYYQPEESYLDIEQNPNVTGGETTMIESQPRQAMPEGSNSASIKSVHTIISQPVSQSNRPQAGAGNFVNLTPTAVKSPVTVVDMRNVKKKSAKKNIKTKKKKHKQKEKDDAGFSVIPTGETVDKKRKKGKRGTRVRTS